MKPRRLLAVAILVLWLVPAAGSSGKSEDALSTMSITMQSWAGFWSCGKYEIIGICVWLVCSLYECHTEESLLRAHYQPDVVVTASNAGADIPWNEANMIYGNLETGALGMFYSYLNHGKQGGGNRAEEGLDDHKDQPHEDLIFKDTSAIGNPIAGEIDCPSQTSNMKYHFLASVDSPFWRDNLVEKYLPPSWIPGMREVGTFFLNTWGSVYPRIGFIYQAVDPKAAAVTAQRTADIITQEGQPHLYQALSGSASNGDDLVFPPAQCIERDATTCKWQMLTPKASASCEVFGVNDLYGSDWADGKVAQSGDYAWNLWRPYKCCEIKGEYLYKIEYTIWPPSDP